MEVRIFLSPFCSTALPGFAQESSSVVFPRVFRISASANKEKY
jgi:hypothetical protein